MAARYGWIVTKDFTESDDNKTATTVEVIGPRDISPKMEAALKAGKGKFFKMYDDDGNLYYSGRIVGQYDGFEPLWDYGMPNAGAVTIKMRNKDGKMEAL